MSTVVKALALVLFVVGIGAASYGVQVAVGGNALSVLFGVTTPDPDLNGTAGQSITYLLTIHNRDPVSRDATVEISGVAQGRSSTTTIRGTSNATLFVTAQVADGTAPGPHDLVVRVLVDGQVVQERQGLLSVQVLDPAEGFQQGDSAEITFTGRLSATGRVFNTNDRTLIGLNVPKTDSYRFSDGNLRIVTTPRISTLRGVYEGLLGMQPGETRTVSFPPEKGYGPAVDDVILARNDVLTRNTTLLNDVITVPRASFDEHIRLTDQGNPADYTVGSRFLVEQESGERWPYQIMNVTEQTVSYRFAGDPGSFITLYPFWQNATEIIERNETHVKLRTTPNTAIGQPITIKQFWPQMSVLTELNETHMVVKNTPPVGYRYTHLTAAGQPRDATVREVTDTQIIVALPAENALAGKDLTFDLTLLQITKGS